MKFSITDFCNKYPQFPADLITFTEEIRNGKLHFLCSGGMFVIEEEQEDLDG